MSSSGTKNQVTRDSVMVQRVTGAQDEQERTDPAVWGDLQGPQHMAVD